MPVVGWCRVAAARNRREDRHLVAVFELGVQSVPEADVLSGDIDVHEATQAAVLGDAIAQIVVLLEDRIERLTDGRTLDLDLALAVRHGPELRWDLHCDRHGAGTLARGGYGLEARLAGTSMARRVLSSRTARSPCSLQLALEGLEGRLDLVHPELVARRVERFQSLAR